MRDWISDNFDVCFTHRELQCWKCQHNSTGKTFPTLTAIPAPFCCTWLKDSYEVTMKFTGKRGSLSLQNSRSTFSKLLPQEGEMLKDAAASALWNLHSSPTSPRLWESTNSAQGPTRHWGHSLLTPLKFRVLLWLLFFTATFSAQSNSRDGEDSNVLLMTCSLSQRSQPSLLLTSTAGLYTWLCTSIREALETRVSSQSNVLQISQRNVQTSKHKALETLESKLPSFGLLHVLSPRMWSLTVTAVTIWMIY